MKNKLVKSTVILVIGGLITKILGMFIKIIMSRNLGDEGIGYYMIIMPTFTLLIALAQFGFPIAISKLVSEDKKNNKNLVFSLIPVSLVINVFIIIILFICSSTIANLLGTSIIKDAIISIGLVLPFISISSILRGYFFGKERMVPHVISNIIEDMVRLIILVIGIPIFMNKGLRYALSFVVLSNIVSELTSIFVLFFFLPHNFTISKMSIHPNKGYIKEVLNISVPSTASRIIGSIGYFLEPIIITYILGKIGYTSSFIIKEYGIINGYVLPLVLLPSFFTMAISGALLPILSKSCANKNYLYMRNKLRQGIMLSLGIGIPFIVIVCLFPIPLLRLLYNTNQGANYILFFAPLSCLEYIQSPLTICMQAMNMPYKAMKDTILGMIIRTISLIILSYMHIGLYGLLVADGLNIVYVTFNHYLHIKKWFKKNILIKML